MQPKYISFAVILTLITFKSFAQPNTFPATGKVGIGITVPWESLHLQGTTSAILFNPDYFGGAFIYASKTDRSYASLGLIASAFTVSTGPNANSVFERIRILENGNIGIGTQDTKGYKLAVAGNVIAESVKVKLQGNWPDYVFDAGYQLPGLQALEKYIAANKHLPEIPSAKEIQQADGVDLNEMNKKLLQKVEELTLYLIEQNKRIIRLENKLTDTTR